MKRIVFLFYFSSFSIGLFAWGQTRHRAIAQIAQNHLTTHCAKQIAELLEGESLVEASTWMDEIKSDSNYDYTHGWHYVTVPDGKDYHTAKKSNVGDVYEAIQRMTLILKDTDKSKTEKKEAVRMLIHLVGDIHQPLHVGNGKDRGGNSVTLNWFNKPSNLHRIWDSGMIDSKQYSYSELAQLIDIPKESSLVNPNLFDLDLWVQEAVELRPQIYEFYSTKNLAYDYLYNNWKTVKLQLLKSGVRLAAILNETFKA